MSEKGPREDKFFKQEVSDQETENAFKNARIDTAELTQFQQSASKDPTEALEQFGISEPVNTPDQEGLEFVIQGVEQQSPADAKASIDAANEVVQDLYGDPKKDHELPPEFGEISENELAELFGESLFPEKAEKPTVAPLNEQDESDFQAEIAESTEVASGSLADWLNKYEGGEIEIAAVVSGKDQYPGTGLEFEISEMTKNRSDLTIIQGKARHMIQIASAKLVATIKKHLTLDKIKPPKNALELRNFLTNQIMKLVKEGAFDREIQSKLPAFQVKTTLDRINKYGSQKLSDEDQKRLEVCRTILSNGQLYGLSADRLENILSGLNNILGTLKTEAEAQVTQPLPQLSEEEVDFVLPKKDPEQPEFEDLPNEDDEDELPELAEQMTGEEHVKAAIGDDTESTKPHFDETELTPAEQLGVTVAPDYAADSSRDITAPEPEKISLNADLLRDAGPLFYTLPKITSKSRLKISNQYLEASLNAIIDLSPHIPNLSTDYKAKARQINSRRSIGYLASARSAEVPAELNLVVSEHNRLIKQFLQESRGYENRYVLKMRSLEDVIVENKRTDLTARLLKLSYIFEPLEKDNPAARQIADSIQALTDELGTIDLTCAALKEFSQKFNRLMHRLKTHEAVEVTA